MDFTQGRSVEFVWWELLPSPLRYEGAGFSTWFYDRGLPEALEDMLLRNESAVGEPDYDFPRIVCGDDVYDMREHGSCIPPQQIQTWSEWAIDTLRTWQAELANEMIRWILVVMGCFVIAATLRRMTTLWEQRRLRQEHQQLTLDVTDFLADEKLMAETIRKEMR